MSSWDKEIKFNDDRRLTVPCSQVLWLTAQLLFAYQHGSMSQQALSNWLVELWQVDLDGSKYTPEEFLLILKEARAANRQLLKK